MKTKGQDLVLTQCQVLEAISQHYEDFKDKVDLNLLSDLQILANDFKQNSDNSLAENRLLRIGIVGQIKRGKSSFLNSLLFDGQDILPKAATPMTAALTRISFSDIPSATVEFYTKDEWGKVKASAARITKAQQEYDQALNLFHMHLDDANQRKFLSESKRHRPVRPVTPHFSDEDKACKELVDMAISSDVNVEEFLGKNQTIIDVNSNSDLVDKLQAFVGVGGRFTPIVKSTELKLNVGGLRDIEVVDTPGMNDPIISRSRRTQEYIGQCDVIFLLSYCGQFLDMHDMSLLAQNIPNKGIEDIVLIGSIFDGVLLDAYSDYDSIQRALPSLTRKLSQQASDNVKKVCSQYELKDPDGTDQDHLMAALKKALPPIFVSSRCLDLANKGDALNEEERHSLEQLNGMFKGFTFTPDILRAVGNFAKVNESLSGIRNKKDQILRDRFNNLWKGLQRELFNLLKKIREDVHQKHGLLLEGDIAGLAEKQQNMVRLITAGETKVKAVFESYRIRAEKHIKASHESIKQDAIVAKQIQTRSGSRQESTTVCTGTERHGFLWLKTRNVYETSSRTVNYTYANAQESVGMLENFVVETSRDLFEVSTTAINLDKFRQDIKEAVKGMFDFSDPDFDPDLILAPLTNAIDRLTIPSINLDLDHHISIVREQFNSGEVVGDDVAKLRTEQARVVSLLLSGIGRELESCMHTMLNKMTEEEEKFIPDLTRNMLAKVEQLKKDMKEKELSLATYQQIIDLVDKDIAAMQIH